MTASADELIIVARAVRTRGLKGEMVAELLTDFPERFEEVNTLVGVSPDGQRRAGQLEDYWFQNDRVILKLAGYDNVERCKELVGYNSPCRKRSGFLSRKTSFTSGS